jgi:hypothetical protein
MRNVQRASVHVHDSILPLDGHCEFTCHAIVFQQRSLEVCAEPRIDCTNQGAYMSHDS